MADNADSTLLQRTGSTRDGAAACPWLRRPPDRGQRPRFTPIRAFVTDLFATANPAAPLADRLRPTTIDEVIGQRHLLAPGKPLAVAFASGKPHSMLLWGPPGVGKTTLARLMARAFNAEFIALSAVLAGVKDIRDAVARAEATLAQSGRHTILFVDEVHRFNKAQQDAFLPYVEAGARHVHRRDDRESLVRGQQRAVVPRGRLRAGTAVGGGARAPARCARSRSGRRDSTLDPQARETLIAYADGDGRRLVNLVEYLATAAGGGAHRRPSMSHSSKRRSRAVCAASTRAARRSTTRSPRCTSRCAGRIRMRRSTGCAGCSTAAPIRSTSAGD